MSTTIDKEAEAQAAPLKIQVFLSPMRVMRGGGQTFSPVTSTLIFGRSEAVLVDAQFIKEDIDALGDLIGSVGRKLTTIFITHGHADHYFGADRLASRFNGARVVARPGVVDYIAANRDRDVKMFTSMFGDEIVVPETLPSPLDGDVIQLEDEALQVIDVEQGDIAPSTVLHVASLGAVMTGDVAYNQIHQMLALSGPAEWRRWIASIEVIRRLSPRIVVAGHKKPEARNDEPERILGETRSYIEDFMRAATSAPSAESIVKTMSAKYPSHGNLTPLTYSAAVAMKVRPT